MIRPAFACLCSVSLAALVLVGCQRGEPTAKPDTPAAATPPAAPIAVDPNLLTADGLGVIRVGQTVAEVEAAAGAPATPIANPADCNIFHPSKAPAGVFVMTEEGRVSRVTLREGATIKADRGFGVGSDGAAIKAAYGGGVISQPAKYDPAPAEDLFLWSRGGSTAYVTDPTARGVRFEIGADGKVKAVHAGGPSIQLAESCG